jgi:hypothetical protein
MAPETQMKGVPGRGVLAAPQEGLELLLVRGPVHPHLPEVGRARMSSASRGESSGPSATGPRHSPEGCEPFPHPLGEGVGDALQERGPGEGLREEAPPGADLPLAREGVGGETRHEEDAQAGP